MLLLPSHPTTTERKPEACVIQRGHSFDILLEYSSRNGATGAFWYFDMTLNIYWLFPPLHITPLFMIERLKAQLKTAKDTYASVSGC
jgi:hypothetical protein